MPINGSGDERRLLNYSRGATGQRPIPMHAWQHARSEARSNMDSHLSSESGYGDGESLLISWLKSKSRYQFSPEDRECFFCGANKGAMSTGVLPVVGAVWKCKGCQRNYDSIKKGNYDPLATQ